MTNPELSIVVVHHRGLGHLREALEAIEAAAPRDAEILLVDNTGGTALEAALRPSPRVCRVAAGGNVGFAAGCRLGVEAAKGGIVLFVNDDAVIDARAPELLAAALAGPDDVVAAAGRLTDLSGRRNDFSDGFLTFDGHAFADESGRAVEALSPAKPGEDRLFACGALMAVRRDAFLDSGGFDDDYFAYLEDVDFGWRQWIFGRRVIAEPRAVARHRGGATGESFGFFSRGFLFERNAFATAFKNLDTDHFRRLMPAIFGAFLGRVAEMISSRNPGAAELLRDPFAPAPSRRLNRLARVFGIREAEGPRVTIDDPLTVAQLRALVWIHRNRDRLAAKRRWIQTRRRRPDADIFARFPLRIVPTYPGDEQFESEYFRELLSAAPPLVRTALSEIFEAAS